jgi:hypothetical protein
LYIAAAPGMTPAMPDLRRIAAIAFTALAFAAAACGDDEESNDGGGGNSDAPVNTDTPGQPEDEGAAPNAEEE